MPTAVETPATEKPAAPKKAEANAPAPAPGISPEAMALIAEVARGVAQEVAKSIVAGVAKPAEPEKKVIHYTPPTATGYQEEMTSLVLKQLDEAWGKIEKDVTERAKSGKPTGYVLRVNKSWRKLFRTVERWGQVKIVRYEDPVVWNDLKPAFSFEPGDENQEIV